MFIDIDVEILNKLNDAFSRDIRIINVFGYKVTEALVVTKDDKCYTLNAKKFLELLITFSVKKIFTRKVVFNLLLILFFSVIFSKNLRFQQ
jgi:hypothetical protein